MIDFIFNYIYFFTYFHFFLIILLFSINVNWIIKYLKFDKKTISILILIILLAFALRININTIRFGYGKNIQDSLTGYSLYNNQRWVRCEGGSLNKCLIYTAPNHPIGHAFILSNLYHIFGFPLNYEDSLFSMIISSSSILLFFILCYLLFENSAISLIASFLMAIFHDHILMAASKETSVYNLFFILASQIFLILSLKIKTKKFSILTLFVIVWSFIFRPNSIITVLLISIFYLYLNKKSLIFNLKKSKIFIKNPIFILITISAALYFFVTIISLVHISKAHYSILENLSFKESISLQAERFFYHLTYYFKFIKEQGYFIFPLFIFLFLKRKNKIKQKKYLLLWYILSVVSFSVYPGEKYSVSPHYMIVSFLPFFILSAGGIFYVFTDLLKKRSITTFFYGLLVCLLIYVLINNSLIALNLDPTNFYEKQDEINEIIHDIPKIDLIINSHADDMRFLILNGYSANDMARIHLVEKKIPDKETIFIVNDEHYELNKEKDIEIIEKIMKTFNTTKIKDNNNYKTYRLTIRK
ncbi:hypothetical protein GF327_07660 [Candidatus Woesearchaeota archaeon]|nr:hypothetical protein [Candidatus Woesearchaeota archaeon]